jgi:hypothetical protein
MNHFLIARINSYTISCQAQERIGKAPRGQLAMDLGTTVLRQRIAELDNPN